MLRNRPHTQQLIIGQLDGFDVELGAQGEVVEFVSDLQTLQFEDGIHWHKYMVLLRSDPTCG